MALLSMGLVGCNQDFDTEFVPQTNPQESLLQMSDVSVAVASATTIDLADFINERWKGIYPIAWGTTLADAQYMASVYKGLCGLDKIPRS